MYRNPLHEKPSDQPLAAYLLWLEPQLRDETLLKKQQEALRINEPDVFRFMAERAYMLSRGDPKSHSTYFGSFLLQLSEMGA